MRLLFLAMVLVSTSSLALALENPFTAHGRIQVASSGTYLEHADGTPFFFLADTCWTGPALSTEEDWQKYLADRVHKGFTAIQFNMVSPWRTAPTDAEGNISYVLGEDGQLALNEKFYRRLDARLKAINDAGLLAVPVLCWAHKAGDAGKELSDEQIITLCKLQVARYGESHVLWILAGDNQYQGADADRWKRIGRAVFQDYTAAPVTTHPTGENYPWQDWENEDWLTVLSYQSGHGDSDKTMKWLHSGPVVEYGKRKQFTRPIINLEPPYEDHVGYSTKKPHTDYTVRRAIYWSLLATPVAGFTYGGHGVWSWHTKPGEPPTDHKGAGVAKVWQEALDLPGAHQVKHVRTLMNEINWTTLRPEQAIIAQDLTDASKFAMCAKDSGNTYVIYFPAGSKAAVMAHIRGEKDSVRWFNPRNGEFAESSRGLLPPDENDWVLLLKP